MFKFHKFLHICIHLILAAVYSCKRFCLWLRNAVEDLPWKLFSYSTYKRAIIDKNELQKIPDHIAIVLNEEHVDYISLCDLSIWCFLCGVKYLTIADVRKNLKSEVLEKKLASLHTPQLEPISSHADYVDMKDAGKHNIIFTTISNERRKFVKTIQHLSSEEVAEDAVNKDVFDVIHKKQSCGGGIVDPNVLISFGPYYSLYGYAPWDVRLSEIFTLQSHQNLSYSSFIKILHSYSKCNQRQGK